MHSLYTPHPKTFRGQIKTMNCRIVLLCFSQSLLVVSKEILTMWLSKEARPWEKKGQYLKAINLKSGYNLSCILSSGIYDILLLCHQYSSYGTHSVQSIFATVSLSKKTMNPYQLNGCKLNRSTLITLTDRRCRQQKAPKLSENKKVINTDLFTMFTTKWVF